MKFKGVDTMDAEVTAAKTVRVNKVDLILINKIIINLSYPTILMQFW